MLKIKKKIAKAIFFILNKYRVIFTISAFRVHENENFYHQKFLKKEFQGISDINKYEF